MKRFFKVLLFLLAVVAVLAVATLTTVDDSPYQSQEYYKQTLAGITQMPAAAPGQALQVGWAKVNLTPETATPTAGYGDREGKPYQSLHDSVYVRAFVVSNGTHTAAIVSADLLIIPPSVTTLLTDKLSATGIDYQNVYLGATHTHNSLGAWGKGRTGEMFAGKYDTKTVEYIANKIAEAVVQAQKNVSAGAVGYGQMYVADMLYNRLVGDKGTLDPFVRVLKFKKNTGETAVLCTYAAHATTLDANKLVLSRDYPGVLVDSLERRHAFAMFMAGAVGSMGPLEEAKDDYEQMRNEAIGVQIEVEKNLYRIEPKPDNVLAMNTLPLYLREPHARISNGLRLRPYVFNEVIGQERNEIKTLRMGNILMIGLPCDFSGELMAELTQYAESKGVHLMVTSFNGGYIGYVTPDKYYSMDTYETRTMNWFGPQNGAYFSEIIKKIVDKM